MAFEDPEELGLDGLGHLANLVEDERAPVRCLELTDLLFGRSGEGALLVAKEFALKQRLGERGAVEADAGATAAVACLMDRPGHELLARAALAPHEDGGLGGGHAADLLHDSADRRARSDHFGLLAEPLPKLLILIRGRGKPR